MIEPCNLKLLELVIQTFLKPYQHESSHRLVLIHVNSSISVIQVFLLINYFPDSETLPRTSLQIERKVSLMFSFS